MSRSGRADLERRSPSSYPFGTSSSASLTQPDGLPSDTYIMGLRIELVLVGTLLAARPAEANDLGDAVGWLARQGVEVGVDGEEAKHDALPMLNSRNVDGRGLDEYRCEDAPIDGFATMRTNGQQGWALRACTELKFRQDHVAGFVTMGPPPLLPADLQSWLRAAEGETDVPAKLLETIARFVSGFRPGLISEQGHYGLLQLRPEVLAAQGLSHGDLLDPAENLRVGARYLRGLVFRFGDIKLAVAAFRDGPAVIEASGGKLPQDRRYRWFVREVTRLYFASNRRFPDEIGADAMRFVWEWLQ